MIIGAAVVQNGLIKRPSGKVDKAVGLIVLGRAEKISKSHDNAT